MPTQLKYSPVYAELSFTYMAESVGVAELPPVRKSVAHFNKIFLTLT